MWLLSAVLPLQAEKDEQQAAIEAKPVRDEYNQDWAGEGIGMTPAAAPAVSDWAATGEVAVPPVPLAGGYPPATAEDWSAAPVEAAVTDWSAAAPASNEWGGTTAENWN